MGLLFSWPSPALRRPRRFNQSGQHDNRLGDNNNETGIRGYSISMARAPDGGQASPDSYESCRVDPSFDSPPKLVTCVSPAGACDTPM